MVGVVLVAAIFTAAGALAQGDLAAAVLAAEISTLAAAVEVSAGAVIADLGAVLSEERASEAEIATHLAAVVLAELVKPAIAVSVASVTIIVRLAGKDLTAMARGVASLVERADSAAGPLPRRAGSIRS